MLKTIRVVLACLVAGAAFSPTAVAQEVSVPSAKEPSPTVDEIVAALREQGVVEVSPEGYDLKQWKLRDVKPRLLLRSGGQYFIVDDETGALMSGWMEDPTTLEFGDWRNARTFARGMAFPPLPEPPAGFALRTVFAPAVQGVRVTGDPTGRYLYVLGLRGDIWRYDLETGTPMHVARARDYLADAEGLILAQGFCFDSKHRMYVVTNAQDESTDPQTNRVTIWRTPPVGYGSEDTVELRPWLRTSYPQGTNNFNHGVGHIAQGPDGMLYVGSGARTDANEDADEPDIADGGEVELTANLWRLDPEEDDPTIHIHAHGLRNAFGFDWDGQGRLWATDNGPNEDPPGELNLIEPGAHYGYPYRFAELDESPYDHTPDPPVGLEFHLPVINVGPDGGGTAELPMATFTPHSSPNGMAYLGDAFPEAWRGGLAVTRFGNMLPGRPVGYDLLLVKVRPEPRDDGRLVADVHLLLERLARPLDVYAAPTGKLYILEHNREPFGGASDWMPRGAAGRLLELAPIERAAAP